jgi:hypothetical protein
MGERGLARKGWLAKMGQKMYALSKEGQRVVRRLVEGDTEPEPEEEPTAAPLPREQEKILVSLLDSSAMQKFSNNRTQDLSFADACRFWGITDNLSGEALDSRLDSVEHTLAKVERMANRGTFLVGHREVTKVDLELLREVHDQLQERFARHLTLLRARAK